VGKIDDLKAYKEWEEYYKSLLRDKAVDDLTPAQRRAMLDKLERDPVEWIKFFFAEFCKYPFTSFQKRAIRRICGNPEWYEVLSWSRELAKSTITFMCVMHLVCTGKKRNVLLASNSHDNAERLLDPYRKSFESNSLLKAYYGDLRSVGQWTAGEFCLTTGASFRALGALESPRGSRKDAVRPDVVLVDDYDTDAECRNPDIVKKKWEWFESALLPTRSVSEPFLVVWCGNIIALNCCTRLAGERADNWDIINIRDKHGRSTWPEKNSEAHIDRIIKTMSTRAFQQEYCNNPLAEGETFKELTWGKCPPLSRLRFAVAYGDPAPSNSKNKATSFKAVFLIGYHDGNFYVYTGYLDHVTNDEYVNWYYYIRDYVNNKTQVYNYIENNKLQDPFYEQVFMPLFTAKGKTNGFIGIIPDTRKKPEKFDRIEGNLEPLNRQGRLILNADERDNPHMRRLEEQFLLVNRAMKSPADGVDCVEGGVWIVNQKITTLTSGSYTIGQRRVSKKRF
jgi:hypothetical protein bfra3_13615